MKILGSHKFNKNARSHKARSFVKKIVFLPIIVVLGFIIVITSMSKMQSRRIATDKPKFHEYVTEVPRQEINPMNADGSVNGLNLLLIAQMSDSYIKDYLQTFVDNQEGKLNSNPYHIPMSVALSIVMTEEGGYTESGGPIPLSYLPWDAESHSPLWKKSKNGIPAESITLQQANKNVLGGSMGSGPIPACKQADNLVADWSNGGTYGPFQIALNEVDDSQKANINGYQADSGRGFDWFYFPDNLSHLDHRLDVTTSLVNYDALSEDGRMIAYSLQYNPGSGAMSKELGNTPARSAERNANIEDLVADFNKVYEKYGAAIASHNWGYPNAMYTAVCLALCDVAGWQYTGFGNVNYQEAADVICPGQTVSEFLASHTSGSGTNAHAGLRSFGSFEKPGAQYHIGDIIALGHAYVYVKNGNYYYARLLQLGGVAGVDPTNPSTYMNQMKDEWTPSGSVGWLEDLGIDIKSLSKKRVEILNQGHAFIGTPYVQARPWVIPPKNPDGTYNVAAGKLDCSAFVHVCIELITGQDVGANTWGQAANSNFTVISPSQAKAGDVWQPNPGHTTFFLKDNGDGSCWVLHTGNTRDNCCIKQYWGWGGGVVYRLNGIDD